MTVKFNNLNIFCNLNIREQMYGT